MDRGHEDGLGWPSAAPHVFSVFVNRLLWTAFIGLPWPMNSADAGPVMGGRVLGNARAWAVLSWLSLAPSASSVAPATEAAVARVRRFKAHGRAMGGGEAGLWLTGRIA